jgi:hypothetical protein
LAGSVCIVASVSAAAGKDGHGYDKRERIYQGTIDVASISIWLRDPVP